MAMCIYIYCYMFVCILDINNIYIYHLGKSLYIIPKTELRGFWG